MTGDAYDDGPAYEPIHSEARPVLRRRRPVRTVELPPVPAARPRPTCDHCGQPMRPDVNGWWVGADETSDCDGSLAGHEVSGWTRPH